METTDTHTNDEKVVNTNLITQNPEVKFGKPESESDGEDTATKNEDLSNYTVVDADHLSEDPVIPGQQYCLLSFMSPEGIMNCNVRAVKFRGAFPSLKEAQKHAEKLEKEDKYFKILAGETGKWLDFDPPAAKVEKEVSSNKEYQKILDAQTKQRMDKLNTLAKKHKDIVDKKDKGKEARKTEANKAVAASDAVEKHNIKKQEKQEKVK